jgi:hypothetical protein
MPVLSVAQRPGSDRDGAHGPARCHNRLTAGIFERLGCSAQSWQDRMAKLRDGRVPGRFLETTRAKLGEIAARLGIERPLNVAGGPVQITRHRIT